MNILRAYVKKIAEDKREEERILREKFRLIVLAKKKEKLKLKKEKIMR